MLTTSSYDMYKDVEGKLGLIPDTDGLPGVAGTKGDKELPAQLVTAT